jgi:ABC-type phosphate/phosphonate transport system permease subunit
MFILLIITIQRVVFFSKFKLKKLPQKNVNKKKNFFKKFSKKSFDYSLGKKHKKT